jgi:hypothetical protein
VKGGKKIFQANRAQKQTRVDILVSEKADIKPKLDIRDKMFTL